MTWPEYLKSVKERAEKATPGPYYLGVQNDALYLVAGKKPALNNDYPNHKTDRTVIAKVFITMEGEFIAHSRTDIPLLLKRIDELTEALGFYAEYTNYLKVGMPGEGKGEPCAMRDKGEKARIIIDKKMEE